MLHDIYIAIQLSNVFKDPILKNQNLIVFLYSEQSKESSDFFKKMFFVSNFLRSFGIKKFFVELFFFFLKGVIF